MASPNGYPFFLFLSDPTYVVAPVTQSRSGRQDLKKLFEGSVLFSCSRSLESVRIFLLCYHSRRLNYSSFFSRFIFLK